MQRREFARTLLLGAGAACTLSAPSAFAGLDGYRNKLPRPAIARAIAAADGLHWRALGQCPNGACPASGQMRVAIDSIGFPAASGSLDVHALFATIDGLRPFRIATHRPEAISPSSKPFAFEVDAAGLAGFRVESPGAQANANGIAASALLVPGHPALSEGRYLLILADASHARDLDTLQVPREPGDPLVDRHGRAAGFAYLAFSVMRSGA